MEDKHYSRRKFLNSCLRTAGFMVGAPLLLTSCDTGQSKDEKTETTKSDSEDPCGDLSGISADEIKKRQSLGYVKKTPNPEHFCGNCSLYIPAKEGEDCGGCLLFKGPVHFNGYCIQWAEIAPSA